MGSRQRLFLEHYRGFVDSKYPDVADRKRIMIARGKMMREGKHTSSVTQKDRDEVQRLEKEFKGCTVCGDRSGGHDSFTCRHLKQFNASRADRGAAPYRRPANRGTIGSMSTPPGNRGRDGKGRTGPGRLSGANSTPLAKVTTCCNCGETMIY